MKTIIQFRNKKNKLGFTLVELLTVVILIGIIGIIFMPKILERFEGKKGELSAKGGELIFMAANEYLQNNPDFASENSCVTISDLLNAGNLIDPVIDIETNTTIPSSAGIKYTYEDNQYQFVYKKEGCN